MCERGEFVYYDVRIVTEGDGGSVRNLLAVGKAEGHGTGYGGVGGGEDRLCLAHAGEGDFLAAQGCSGDEVEVGTGNGDVTAGHQLGGAYSRNGGVHQGVSDRCALTVCHHEGYVAFGCREGNCSDGDASVRIGKASIVGSGEVDGGNHVKVLSADDKFIACLYRAGRHAQARGCRHFDAAGGVLLAGIVDKHYIAALRGGGNRDGKGGVVTVQDEVRDVDLDSACKDDGLDHVEVFAADNHALSGLGIGRRNAAHGGVAYSEGFGCVDQVGGGGVVLEDEGAGDCRGGNGYAHLITAGAFLNGHYGAAGEFHCRHEVHVVALDGDDVTGHGRGGAERIDDDGLDVGEFALGFQNGAVRSLEGHLAHGGAVGRQDYPDFTGIAALDDLDVGKGACSGNVHFDYLVEVAAVERKGAAAHDGIGAEGSQGHRSIGILVGGKLILTASREQKRSH